MTFEEVLDQAIALLQRRGRVTYRTLKRQFQLDDAAMEDLTVELIKGQQLAVDEDGEVLVWSSNAAPPPVPAGPPAPAVAPAPVTYTPAYLAEKILISRSTLEGERKQVTVLFADLKGSMELLADRDPKDARQVLDPVLERMMAAVHRYEGTVNQVMGDGIMALFGAPLAHEDHAVRACYAALAMQEAVGHYGAARRRSQGLDVARRQQAEEEAALLARVEENSRLPAAAQRRYEQLRRKRERGTLTEGELTESQALLQQLEARNVKRIEALIALAQRRGTTLRGIMAELGLHSEAKAPSSSSLPFTDSPQLVNEGRLRRGRRGFPARARQRSARA